MVDWGGIGRGRREGSSKGFVEEELGELFSSMRVKMGRDGTDDGSSWRRLVGSAMHCKEKRLGLCW